MMLDPRLRIDPLLRVPGHTTLRSTLRPPPGLREGPAHQVGELQALRRLADDQGDRPIAVAGRAWLRNLLEHKTRLDLVIKRLAVVGDAQPRLDQPQAGRQPRAPLHVGP